MEDQGAYGTAASPTPAKVEWKEAANGRYELNAEVVVLQIWPSGDKWLVTSSHGKPEGPFSSLEAAQAHGNLFACIMIEKSMHGLTELEAHPVLTIGYKAKPCGVLCLMIPPPDPQHEKDEHGRWTNEDGTVNSSYAEAQKLNLIRSERARCQRLLDALRS